MRRSTDIHAIPITPSPSKASLQPSIAIYRASETALSAASNAGRLLSLKEGAVKVIKQGVTE